MTSQKNLPIAIVTGLEHSGTTYLATLIKLHPKVQGGFECGFLSAKTPQAFIDIKPHSSWMQRDRHDPLLALDEWRISAQNMQDILNSKTWEEMYAKVVEYSPLFKNKTDFILDKTPCYMPILDDVLDKVISPCIVIHKTIEFQYYSYQRRGVSLYDFAARYISYTAGLLRALEKYPERIMVVGHEDLCAKTCEKMEIIYEFIGLDFFPEEYQEDVIRNLPHPKLRDFEYSAAIREVTPLTPRDKAFLKRRSIDKQIMYLYI